MKSKIEAVFESQKFTHISFADKELHIVDYTERTDSVRSVEVHNVKPMDIDSLIIHNPTQIDISTSIFTPHCFIDENGCESKQCECVMSPTNLTENVWVLFVEIKDCKAKNASNYHNHLIKASEWKQFRDNYKIMLKGTNEVRVKNERSVI